MNFSIKALYNWYRNSLRNPKYRGWIIAGTLAYLLSPFDISPDVFPLIGQIDDLALLTLFISELSQLFIEDYKKRQVNTQPKSNEADSQETVDVDAVPIQD
ncbi:YkvA family protein [Acaryochloris sp. CCMEE 5410]|uniref:YkvA family protein n=1 Tax=Acaryochloris sp. CCMEE 5410 TaxID=310037 RepID=UPI000248421E|nr:YkvA family protein [Acaryochloris sp. CCMEE 5410]KAI9132907.1 DUF1232 domain-containing protein [Acaryochloris sp. CCMEE 5410]